jgi:hypothetical protein
MPPADLMPSRADELWHEEINMPKKLTPKQKKKLPAALKKAITKKSGKK